MPPPPPAVWDPILGGCARVSISLFSRSSASHKAEGVKQFSHGQRGADTQGLPIQN